MFIIITERGLDKLFAEIKQEVRNQMGAVAAQVNATNAQLRKAKTEIISAIESGGLDDEDKAALAENAQLAQELDDLNPDTPSVPVSDPVSESVSDPVSDAGTESV